VGVRLRARRLSRIAVVASLLLVLAAPAGADAAALTLRDTGVTGSAILGDGARYIAAVTSPSAVTVIDTRGGARSVLPIPAGCTLADVHHGSLLWTCEQPPDVCCGRFDTGIVQNIATGARRALPRAPLRAGDNVSEVGHWSALGDRFVRSTHAGYHVTGSLYTDLMTGRVRQVDERRDTVVQLDGPQLTRHLCSGQLRPLISDDVGLGLIPGPLATAGGWAASTSYSGREKSGRIRLQRCGQATRTLRRCEKTICSDPVIDARLVAWAESRRGAPVTLTVRSLRSGLVRRVTANAGLAPLLVGDRLYVVRSAPLDGRPLAPVVQRLMRAVL
jgi:hypothetical protein